MFLPELAWANLYNNSILKGGYSMNPNTEHPEWMNDEAHDELTNGRGEDNE